MCLSDVDDGLWNRPECGSWDGETEFIAPEWAWGTDASRPAEARACLKHAPAAVLAWRQGRRRRT